MFSVTCCHKNVGSPKLAEDQFQHFMEKAGNEQKELLMRFFLMLMLSAHCGCCCRYCFNVRGMMLAAGLVVAEFAVGWIEVAEGKDERQGSSLSLVLLGCYWS
ncbi:hypothetical protein PoB_005205800 [Plakobranchus ocellatus]|uniref:Uncharacterized protein n=1 Tax=Plakobranchus ocellatus TaxID=259542 RepID=A0AAV4C0X8_9GAST|nr:hypothetical protein PoB_005205800 [Plakobranchus ocellatus]